MIILDPCEKVNPLIETPNIAQALGCIYYDINISEQTHLSELWGSQRAGVRLTLKKGTPKIPSKSIFPYPNRYIFRRKKNFCHRIRYRKFFGKVRHEKALERRKCWAILTPSKVF